MEETVNKTVKQIIIEKYGSINAFADAKFNKLDKIEQPFAKQYLWKLINHEVENPGIKTLNALADMLEIDREIVYKEYSM